MLRSFSEKVKGLMFEKKVSSVYLETRFGIHTIFVKFPIDVLVMDEKYIVRALAKNLKPWRIFLWDPKYFRVLELPSDFIDKRGILIGSFIKIDPLK